MRNCIRFVLGGVLAAALAGRAAAQGPASPVVTPVKDAWVPRVIATARPVTEVEQAQPVSPQPGRLPSPDVTPVVKRSAAVPEGVRPAGDLSPPQRPAPGGACLVVEKVGPAVVPADKPLVYDVILRNIGTAEARRVRVEEQLPVGSAVLATEPRAEGRDNLLTWDLGTVAAGAEMRLRVTLQPPADGDVSTTATVTCATVSTLHVRSARPAGLSLTVNNPPPAQVGQKVVFRIDVANKTPARLTNVLLQVELSANLQHPAGGKIEAKLPALAPGELQSVPLDVVPLKAGRQSVKVKVTPAEGGPTSTEAAVEVSETSGAAPAPVPAIVTRSPEVRPAAPPVAPALPEPKAPAAPPMPPLPAPPPLPDLSPQSRATEKPAGPSVTLDLADIDAALEVGHETTYEIRVLNQGAAPTRDVLVQAVVPDEMTLVGGDGPAGPPPRVEGQQLAFAPLASLDGQGRAVYRVRVKATKPGDGRFTARLRCGAMDRPLSQEVSTRVYSGESPAGEVTQK